MNQVMFPIGKDNKLFNGAVLVDDDTFDIVTTFKDSCDSDDDVCRVTFDQWGKRIAGPVLFSLNPNEIRGFIPRKILPAQGFYVVSPNVDHDKLLIKRLGFNGTVTHLVKVDYSDYAVKYRVSSNNYNSFSTCWTTELSSKDVHCMQFAISDSRIRLNVTLPISKDSSLKAVYNLPDGLLIMTMKNCQAKCDSFEVTKVLTNGYQSSFLIDQLDLYKYYDDVGIQIEVKDTENEICFIFLIGGPVYDDDKFKEGSMQYRSKCISKGDVEKL